MDRQHIFDSYCDLFEHLTPERIGEFADLVSPSVHFRGPFHDVRGAAKMAALLQGIFVRCREPRVYMLDRNCSDDYAVMRWRFETTVPLMGWFSLEGMTRLQFDESGRISEHLDFWDSAPFFLRLPMLGKLLQRIKAQMLKASQQPPHQPPHQPLH